MSSVRVSQRGELTVVSLITCPPSLTEQLNELTNDSVCESLTKDGVRAQALARDRNSV